MPVTLQERLRTMLQSSPVFQLPDGVRCYPEFAPDDAEEPYLVFFVTGQRDMAAALHFQAAEKAIPVRSLMDWGVQFTAWSDLMLDALTVAAAVRETLIGNYIAALDLSSPDVQITAIRYENTIETGETVNTRFGVITDLQVQGYPPLFAAAAPLTVSRKE